MTSDSPATYCGRCGLAAPTGLTGLAAHPDCQAGSELEPPRYCPRCARRMVVQVDPFGWRAECLRHGELTG